MKKIIDTYDTSDGLVNMFNDKLYKLYTSKQMYPISLKQIISEKANIDYTNKPGTVKVANFNIEIATSIIIITFSFLTSISSYSLSMGKLT